MHIGSDDDDFLTHKPWVYFMIDSFFLVTQFFVLTFHIGAQEVSLPQSTKPAGGTPTAVKSFDGYKYQLEVEACDVDGARFLREQILRAKDAKDDATLRTLDARYAAIPGLYRVAGEPATLSRMQETISALAQTKDPKNIVVKVSYEKDVPFSDVVAVLNACEREKIRRISWSRLRGAE